MFCPIVFKGRSIQPHLPRKGHRTMTKRVFNSCKYYFRKPESFSMVSIIFSSSQGEVLSVRDNSITNQTRTEEQPPTICLCSRRIAASQRTKRVASEPFLGPSDYLIGRLDTHHISTDTESHFQCPSSRRQTTSRQHED